MGFADAARAEQQHVFLPGKKSEIKQFHDRAPIQMRMKGEVVFFDGFGCRKAGGFHGSLDSSSFFGGHLFFEEMIEKAEAGDLLVVRLIDDIIKDRGGPGKFKPGKVVVQPFDGQLFHEPPPSAKRSYSDNERCLTYGSCHA